MFPQERRSPPAFQCYASDVSAQEEYIEASAAERGVFLSMLLYCWVNQSIPAPVKSMARLLRLDENEIGLALRGRLLQRNFELNPGQDRFYCPELERQRRERLAYHEAQANRGRAGGKKTQEIVRKRANVNSSAGPNGDSSAAPSAALTVLRSGLKPSAVAAQAPEMRREESRGNEDCSRPGEVKASERDAWLKDYEAASDAAVAYRDATKGK